MHCTFEEEKKAFITHLKYDIRAYDIRADFFSLGLMIRIVQYVACMTNKAQIVAYKRLMRNILSQ